MHVLVCGGRKFADEPRLTETLDVVHKFRPIALLIHGAAQGADHLAGRWAQRRGVPVKAFPPSTLKWGWPAAAWIRNRQMLEFLELQAGPKLVLAFKGGNGTAHMTRIAEEARVKVIRVK